MYYTLSLTISDHEFERISEALTLAKRSVPLLIIDKRGAPITVGIFEEAQSVLSALDQENRARPQLDKFDEQRLRVLRRAQTILEDAIKNLRAFEPVLARFAFVQGTLSGD